MNVYTLSGLIAFILFGMGLVALEFGRENYLENKQSSTGKAMFRVCISVFFWDAGYAWMSICFDDNFAYIPRAIALMAITFYIYYVLKYVAIVARYPKKRLDIFLTLHISISMIAWVRILMPDTVTFVTTPWGYWYTSEMSWARICQFACVLVGIIQYYLILIYGKKHTARKREQYVLDKFGWFGPILFTGYIFDTLLPSILHIPALPGSCISAFLSVMILFHISRTNKTFGATRTNISEYVFRDVNIPVLVTDSNGYIVLFNEATKTYLEREEDELYARKIEDFFEAFTGELVRVYGSDRKCKLDRTMVKDQFHELLYTICFVQDMTIELENMKKLEESRKLAEEANKAKSNFLANMSHEIRTPMNAIIGMSEIILQDKSLPEKTLSQVNEIHIASNSLLGLINDILDISKIEAGKYELIPADYELASLLNDVSCIISVRVQDTNTRYELHVDPTMPGKLWGDEVRIRQILLNILGNASKYTEKGSITLTAGWNHDEKDTRIFFDVKDTGIGIKPENIEYIFGEFNQVDTRRNRNIQGTGLGLSISKRLAEMMDGEITVESEYGKGSTFHIVLGQQIKEYVPIGEDTVKALRTNQYTTTSYQSRIQTIPRPDARVLIVDDMKLNLMVASGMMKNYGMKIDTAGSGKEAIEMVQKQDYDIVFMDHMMPEMDGVDTTRRIRELGGKYKDLVIIALTANVLGEAKELFSEEGMQDFLGKPISLKALNEIMDKWLPVKEEA